MQQFLQRIELCILGFVRNRQRQIVVALRAVKPPEFVLVPPIQDRIYDRIGGFLFSAEPDEEIVQQDSGRVGHRVDIQLSRFIEDTDLVEAVPQTADVRRAVRLKRLASFHADILIPVEIPIGDLHDRPLYPRLRQKFILRPGLVGSHGMRLRLHHEREGQNEDRQDDRQPQRDEQRHALPPGQSGPASCMRTLSPHRIPALFRCEEALSNIPVLHVGGAGAHRNDQRILSRVVDDVHSHAIREPQIIHLIGGP